MMARLLVGTPTDNSTLKGFAGIAITKNIIRHAQDLNRSEL